MHRAWYTAVLCGLTLFISSCGEPYRREAGLYVDAAQKALIEKNVCADPADCQSRQLLFWNDGEHFFDVWPKDVTFVNLYATDEPSVVDAVVTELRKAQKEISRPGVVLNVFKSKHLEPEIKYQRVVIKFGRFGSCPEIGSQARTGRNTAKSGQSRYLTV